MRDSIQLEEMVCLALRYLASGESFRSLLGRKTVSDIVIDVCTAIFETLGPDYIKTPKITEKWIDIAKF